MLRRPGVPGGVALAVIGLALGWFGSVEPARLLRDASDWHVTAGRVEQTGGGGRPWVYSYRVGGRRYEASSFAAPVTDAPGREDRFTVLYHPDRPWTARLSARPPPGASLCAATAACLVAFGLRSCAPTPDVAG